MSKTLPLVFALLVALEAWAVPPVARLTASRNTCVAPCAVFFDARGTTDGDWDGQLNYRGDRWREFVDLQYTWDFGDPNSGNWTYGASNHSRNYDTGPVAGHLYETPGTFHVQLNVSDGTTSDSASATVTVTSANSQWPGTNTICVSNDTNHAGCPSGARQVSNQRDFDAALRSDCNIDSAVVRCLFKRGDTFTVDASTRISNTGPSMVGAYGTGAKPAVSVSMPGTRPYVFAMGSSSSDFRLMDISFDGNDVDQGLISHPGAGNPLEKLLVLRVDLDDFEHHPYNFYAGGAYDAGVNMHNEIAVFDSTTDGCASGSFDIFICAEKYLFMGNDFGDKGGEEHVFRSCYTHGAVISHNSMGRSCGESRFVIKLHNEHSTGPGAPCSREFIIADNHIEGCQINRMDLDIAPNRSKPEQCVERGIIERNLFELHPNSSYGYKAQVNVSGHGFAIRNNVFNASHPSEQPRSLLVREETAGNTSPQDDNRIYNNVFYTAHNPQQNQAIYIGPNTNRTIVKNNTYWAPNDTGSRWDFIDDNGSGTVFCDTGSGFGDCNIESISSSTPFISSSPSDLLDFTPHSSSPLIDAADSVTGVTPANFPDTAVPIDGNGEGGARIDLGAVEYMGAGSSPPPTPTPTPAPVAPQAPVLMDP